jgi:hypothetical protein
VMLAGSSLCVTSECSTGVLELQLWLEGFVGRN